MKRDRRRRKESPNSTVWGIATVAVIIGGTAAGYFLTKGPVVSDADRGYRFLPNCAGVEVLDQAKLVAYVTAQGKAAAAMPAQPQISDTNAWALAAAAAIGTDGVACKNLKGFSQASFVAVWDLHRYYIKAARDAGKLTADQANVLAAAFRVLFINQGAPADLLPEGLP